MISHVQCLLRQKTGSTMTGMEIIQSLEGGKDSLRSKFQVRKIMNIPVSLASSTSPWDSKSSQVFILSQLRPPQLIFEISNSSNHLIPYCCCRCTLRLVGRTAYDLERLCRHNHTAWTSPNSVGLVRYACASLLSVEQKMMYPVQVTVDGLTQVLALGLKVGLREFGIISVMEKSKVYLCDLQNDC